MQWLSLVNEDTGVQRLKADNRQPLATRSVDAVSAYPNIHPVQLGERTVRERVSGGDRRADAGDRRQRERRQKQVPVLLDTRCSSRRSIENRRCNADPDSELLMVRINVYA
jgi:hypothetical protein